MKLKPELTSQLMEEIRQAIYDKTGEDPHHKFMIIDGTLNKKKREVEVKIIWDHDDSEIMGIAY